MSFGDTDHYRELFLELETTPHRSQLNPAQIQLLTNALKTRWNGLSEFRRNERGRAIQNFHEALKDKSDAQRQLAYVEKYRGAPGDNGSDIWRPRFGLYEEKLRKLVRVLRNVDLRCGQLWRLREKERQGDPVGTWLRDLLDAARTEADSIDDWMRRELSTLRQKAENRARALEEARDDSEENLAIAEEDITANEEQSDLADDDDGSEGEGSESDRAWYGTLYLGGGSYGAAYLWLQVDQRTDTICNRVVCKKANLAPIWNYSHFWTNGAPGITDNISNNLPTEIQAHLGLRGKPGSRSTVEMLNYNLRLADKQADLYLEYCPFGDAFDLLNGNHGYHAAEHTKRIKSPWEDHSDEYKLYPEPFCWAAFQNMVVAGILMERGQLKKAGADPNWPVIVHRDFKIDNIFFGVADDKSFPGYPRAKVGDFGLAIAIPPNDPRDLEALRTQGTAEHVAPEMQVRLEVSNVRRPQSTKTNVWGVGIVMFSLLAGKYGPCTVKETWFDWDRPSRREPPELDASAQAFYSRELVNLVMACMRYNDSDRPSFDHLLAEIRKYTTPGAHDRAFGLRHLSPEHPEYGAKFAAHKLPFGVDDYALGLAYDDSGFEELYSPTTPPAPLAGV
ncbi:hypothetical protein CKM354_000573800 [Cercospora kikuchii]|uniref:non-specific serine/threonine protein kinase n=1 Tax=Cercospora kikuchii TaxID=84275 RepID=A0A9P3FCQ1_9PEZI|nr:uncharacterized protein CKM354_000573800 [Cercospora kikuchii]GIZ42468.1 hypothetical protein CKM354_000573800 [Cercospora kikuchii]